MKTYNTSLRLKELMKSNNYKQVDILKKCEPICKEFNKKIGRNDLSQYVSGKVEPRQDKLYILAKALNVNEAWLMGYEVPMERDAHINNNIINIKENNLLNNFRKLNIKGKDKLIECSEELTQISKYILEEENAIDDELNITELEEVKLYDLPVSAGTGTQLLDDVSYELITIDRRFYPKADFALRVSGDSMEPRFYDGDIIYIKSTNDIDNGKIGIFYYDGEAYLKKLEKENGNICLISLNEKYLPIKVTNDSFKVVGIVL